MATGGGTHSRDWSWRVSIADIARDGPFSVFPGMDRQLTLIEGRGIVLRGVSGSMRLERIGDGVAFPGEQALNVELVDGPVQVWNLMTRRGVVSGSVRLCRGTFERSRLRCHSIALVLEGTYSIRYDEHRDALRRAGDVLWLDPTIDRVELQPASKHDAVLVTEIR